MEALTLRSSMDDIAPLYPYMDRAVAAAGIVGKSAKRLRLVIEEAVANVINHGQATAYTLRAEVEGGRLVITIEDDGLPFDPTRETTSDLSVPPDQRPPGGLGLVLMQRMADSLSYQYTGGHNVLRIEKTIIEH